MPMVDIDHSARLARRAAARRARHRRRRLTAAVAVVLCATVVVAIASGGSSADRDRANPAPEHAAQIIPGGPLAPGRLGGLAALWAPGNVVGSQPATAAAYSAAARRPGLPGYLLIADRGNNRILVVSPQGRIVFLYPDRADLAAGRLLVYNDDTFVEPGGRSLIANEEDNHAIVQIGIANHSLDVLFGHPGQAGPDQTHLNTPDDAYALPNGEFTVADAYNCRILFIRAHSIVRQFGHSGECSHDPPNTFGPVNGDTPEPDGGVLISEIRGNWIDEIGPTGRLRFAVQAPVPTRRTPSRSPGADPARRLRQSRARPDHRPPRQGPVALRARAGPRPPGSPIVSDAAPERRHRGERRLP